MTSTATVDTVVIRSRLTTEEPFTSDKHHVLDVECRSDFSYWAGISSVWGKGLTIVNVEHDMDYNDDLVDGLLDCEYPLCAYAYRVYPTKLQRYIYCATRDRITDAEADAGRSPGWITGPEDEWADWSSIGFCKIAPQAQSRPLDRMFWQWLEHCVHRVVTVTTQDGPVANRLRWHIHWPEVEHFHDYELIPDHLW